VVALAAPRPLLFLSGEDDAGSPPAGIRTIESIVKRAYRIYDQDAAFESRLYPGVGHEYTPDMWQRMLQWMDQHLQPSGTP
jgi:dienelactone hydrolase